MSEEGERVFHDLVNLTAEERASYFDKNITDADVRREVERRLAYDSAGETSADNLVRDQAFLTFQTSGRPPVGATCGPYRLLKLIGRGGMAAVWLAERTDGILKRPVALKLPCLGFYGSHFAERSNRERDILAALTHPGIARLYDAGIAEDGQPYLALEFVEGSSIESYCDAQRLPVRARLELFLQVFAAVQFAHAHLVIHRDLKPSNILVTQEGEVKLLDFGIAKLMVAGEPIQTELTELGGRALTLAYASPEQIKGQPVTTASDIYSLGVILFELLAGTSPFVLKRESRSGIEDAILHEAPRRPSQVISETAASARSTTVKRLATTLQGDLDTIILKSLQKEPDQRYATVEAFRSDIQRHLVGQPVLAQPESHWYRAKKFVGRHKASVLSAAAVFVALAGGLGAALWEARIARNEARTSQAVQEFTEELFEFNSRDQQDPEKARQTTARQLLEIGAQKIDSKLNDAPAAKVRMLEILADLHHDLDLDDEAVQLEKKRVALARRVYGPNSNEVVAGLTELAGALHASRSVNEREKVLKEAQDILDRKHDFTSDYRAGLDKQFAEHYESSDLPKSREYATQAVKLYRQRPISDAFSGALYLEGLASLNLDDSAQAQTAFAEAIRVSKKLKGDPNPDLPRFYAYLAQSEENLFQFSEAERDLRHAFDDAKATSARADIDTLQTESRIGLFLARTSRARESIPFLVEARDLCIKSRGIDDPFYTPMMIFQYGIGLYEFGRPEEALEAVLQAIANRRKNRPGTRFLGYLLEYEAGILIDLGRYDEARALLDESQLISNRVGQKTRPERLAAEMKLAVALDRPLDAIDVIKRYPLLLSEGNRPLSASLFRNLYQRAELALLQKDTDAAIRYASRGRQAVIANPQRLYVKRWEVRASLVEARGYLMRGEAAKALPLLQQIVADDAAMLDTFSPELASAQALLGTCYLDLGDRPKAQTLLAQAKAIRRKHAQLGEHLTRPIQELDARLTNGA